jgi:hypothetical protein
VVTGALDGRGAGVALVDGAGDVDDGVVDEDVFGALPLSSLLHAANEPAAAIAAAHTPARRASRTSKGMISTPLSLGASARRGSQAIDKQTFGRVSRSDPPAASSSPSRSR